MDELNDMDKLDDIEFGINKQNSESLIQELFGRIDYLNAEIQKYKSVVDGALDLIIITDGMNGTILEINEAVSNILGYSADQLKGKHFSTLFPEEMLRPDDSYADNLQMYGPVLSARQVLHADGRQLLMDITINVINYGNSKAVLTILRDASERIRAEKEIKRINSELEKLNADKDKFFTIIAHDLRNPLMGILGLSEILKEDSTQIDEEDRNTIVEQINNSARKLKNLLNNLLDWSWLQTGKIAIKPENVRLDMLIEDVVQLLMASLINKKISLEYNERCGKYIFADPNMIKSVIQNLLSNAIKFTPPEGRIAIRTFSGEGKISCMISDTGVGISETSMKRLFRIGENISTPGTNKESGTGFGLLLCKELVEKNHGTISVKSRPGEGTVFTVTFPENQQPILQVHDTV
ncbi:MAG: ATP-binding protein [Bacteroidota bacterium]